MLNKGKFVIMYKTNYHAIQIRYKLNFKFMNMCIDYVTRKRRNGFNTSLGHFFSNIIKIYTEKRNITEQLCRDHK